MTTEARKRPWSGKTADLCDSTSGGSDYRNIEGTHVAYELGPLEALKSPLGNWLECAFGATLENFAMQSLKEAVQKSGGKFHLFGDSHCMSYHELAGVELHHVGAVTMHRVGRDGSALFDFEQCHIADVDNLGFVFGEIDVRCHVANRQSQFGVDPCDTLETLAKNYLAVLSGVGKQFSSSKLCVFSVVPPAGLHYQSSDERFPRNGSDKERARWSKVLNAFLAIECWRRGMYFIDQFDPFKNEEDLLAHDVSDDGVHIRASLHARVDAPPGIRSGSRPKPIQRRGSIRSITSWSQTAMLMRNSY